jgi:hypothetical protein
MRLDLLEILIAVVAVGGAAMWRLPLPRRIQIALPCLLVGGCSALQMGNRANVLIFLAFATLVLIVAAVVFAPFKSKRVEALSALAAAATLWVGFLGVLLIIRAALRQG